MGTRALHNPRIAWVVALALILTAGLLGLVSGAVPLPAGDVFAGLFAQLLGNPSPLDTTGQAIVLELRLPRVILGLLVGAMLAAAGAAFQGTFRNPLADPYLLGVSAGAGLGATAAFAFVPHRAQLLLPVFAFVGAMFAVTLTYSLGRSAMLGRSATSLVLAGVAVAALLTAVQTLLLQRNADKVRQVYSWTLGRLATSGWDDVRLAAIYIPACLVVLFLLRRVLDVFAVGDIEATSLGLNVPRARLAIVLAASLGTAAAVSVSGMIGFVGIIVPHTLRLLVGASYRLLIPLSAAVGAAFLVFADILARTALAPEEVPIGVVTALLGAPFFLWVLGSAREMS